MTVVVIFMAMSAVLLIGPAIRKRIESRSGISAVIDDSKPKTTKAKRVPKSGRKT